MRQTGQYAALLLKLKKAMFVILGIIFGLSGLLLIPTLLYDICGLSGGQDCADGPRWALVIIILACTVLIGGAFFLSFRLFRLVDTSEHPN